MLSFVLLLVSRPQVEIAVTAHVAPLERLIPALGKQAGIELSAHDSVRADVVGIASPKRPISEILEVIAKAANATWVQGPKGRQLQRLDSQTKADQAADIAYNVGWMRRAIESAKVSEPFDEVKAQALAIYRKEFKNKPNLDSADYAQLDEMNNRSPQGRFTRRLIEGLGLENIARMPQGRTVLSTRPNRRQVLLKESQVRPALDAFVQEQSLFARAAKELGEPNSTSTFVSGFDHVAPPPAGWSRVLIAVDKANPFQYFFYVVLVDKDDLIVGVTRCYMNRSSGTEPSMAERDSPEFTFPPEVLAMGEASGTGKFRSAEVLRPFQKPLERDPLAHFNEPGLAAWREWKKKPVAVLLPDASLSHWNLKNVKNVAGYRARLEGACAFEETESAIIGRPIEPYRAVLDRTDRLALQRVVSAAVGGWAPLRALVEFSPSSRIYSYNLLSSMVNNSFSQEAMSYAKIVAAGDVSQQIYMLAGGKLTLGLMNDTQRAMANHRFFNEGSTEFGVAIGKSIKEERTEKFPDGLPSEVSLTTSFREQPSVQFEVQGRTSWAPSQTLAQYMYRRDDSSPKEFRYAIVQELELALEVGNSSQPRLLRAEQPVDGFAVKKFEELPSAFREEVEKFIKELRQRAGLPPG